jgi:hypothetical protein
MKFLALIYADETTWTDATPEQIAATMQAHGTLGEAAGKAGVMLGRDGHRPRSSCSTASSSTATTSSTPRARTCSGVSGATNRPPTRTALRSR